MVMATEVLLEGNVAGTLGGACDCVKVARTETLTPTYWYRFHCAIYAEAYFDWPGRSSKDVAGVDVRDVFSPRRHRRQWIAVVPLTPSTTTD